MCPGAVPPVVRSCAHENCRPRRAPRAWAPGAAGRALVWAGVLVGLAARLSAAEVITPLVSYEPAETDLTVAAYTGDPGLTVAIVPGGVNGAPVATDGTYLLKLTITNEADHKVEFRQAWSGETYDLAGETELLADVYVASSGALPGLIGIWDLNWAPPDAWQPATGLPTAVGVWATIRFDLSGRLQTGLREIQALVLENLAGSSGTVYVDNLRLRHSGPLPGVAGVAANAYAERVALVWQPLGVVGLTGYNVYRAAAPGGPFARLNLAPVPSAAYTDGVPAGSPRYYYYVTAVVNGMEGPASALVTALYDGLTDEQLLDVVQQATLRYFWDWGHPVCGMAREGLGGSYALDTVTTGGTGMGLMTIVVGAERGFIPRSQAAARVRTILAFLQDVTPRYHGAWSHHYHGVTGATIPFSEYRDDGADLVETAYLVQGFLTVRQYFDSPADPVEAEIRARATQMWESVEWSWFRQHPGSDVLYWNWSPNYGFAIQVEVRGYNEAMITYLLAIASPTYPMPASSFHNGYAGLSTYVNGRSYYGHTVWVGPAYGGRLFFTHYSNLGFDPRYKRDAYANYFDNARHIALIHRDYSIDNPHRFAGYNAYVWGLTSSADPAGYAEHEPTQDNGTLAPTAAISSIPYTPAESLAALRQFYDTYGTDLWGACGFLDAFSPQANWVAPGYIAIDEGTIVPLIENYRSGLCWKLFMANPEIRPMMQAIGLYFEVDFDTDGQVDAADLAVFAGCLAGAGAPCPGGCTGSHFPDSDLDRDADVDLADGAIFQRVFTGP
jgi:hypothetical protein